MFSTQIPQFSQEDRFRQYGRSSAMQHFVFTSPVATTNYTYSLILGLPRKLCLPNPWQWISSQQSELEDRAENNFQPFILKYIKLFFKSMEVYSHSRDWACFLSMFAITIKYGNTSRKLNKFFHFFLIKLNF